jgi:hypothetical protein
MPAKSAKQEKFMQAVAHSPSFAKKVGVPQSVGREFTKAKGGIMKKASKVKALKDMMGRALAARAARGAMAAPAAPAAPMGMSMKKGGSAKKMAGGGLASGHKSADGVASRGKTKGKKVAMCGGGMMKGKK